jgi:5-methyltetrahydropteroyltriglutamate--homocysteine methyltransferase
VVTGALRRRGAIVGDDFTRACCATRLPVKPVLPGPYTLARLCVIESGPQRDVPALAHALSEVLAAEVAELAGAGARLIQIEEPAILAHPGDIRLLRQVLEPLWGARGAAEIALATYFGDAEPLYAQLNSVPADVLVLDFTYSPGLADAIAATGASKTLGLGLVDGRNTRLESAAVVAGQVERILRRYVLERVHLLPSCGLEYLPRASACAKLELLARVRERIEAG